MSMTTQPRTKIIKISKKKKLVITTRNWRQEIVDASVSPMFRGRRINRRCLQIGKGYYYNIKQTIGKDVPLHDWSMYPEVRKMVEKNVDDFDEENFSCLINVYMEKKYNIGYHCDATDNLFDTQAYTNTKPSVLSNCPNVWSVSIPINGRINSSKVLGKMDFDCKENKNTTFIGVSLNLEEEDFTHSKVNSYDIKSGRWFCWNAHQHKEHNIKHRATTLEPRINITVRQHTPTDTNKAYKKSGLWRKL